MSVSNTDPNTTDTDTDDETDDVPHDRYHAVTRMSYPDQQSVADEWADGAFPSHNVDKGGAAVLYTGNSSGVDRRSGDTRGTSTNFHGVQNADGSGTLWHYDTRECVRTVDGLTLSNGQCWSAGFAHCSTPNDRVDHTIPFDAVEALCDDSDDVFDVTNVVSDGRDTLVYIEGDSERYAVYLGYDPSASRDGTSRFAMRLTAEETAKWERYDHKSPSDVPRRLLRPKEAVGANIVTSDEYTKTRLDSAEAAAHVGCGGNMTTVERSWRDDYEANLQSFRGDYQGNVIVRQGEWFFVPTDPDGNVLRDAKPLQGDRSRLGNHLPRDERVTVPDECPDCESTNYAHENDERGWHCADCGESVERTFVRGTVRHDSNEHDMINLGETWHLAVSHDREVLTYQKGVPYSHTGSRARRYD